MIYLQKIALKNLLRKKPKDLSWEKNNNNNNNKKEER